MLNRLKYFKKDKLSHRELRREHEKKSLFFSTTGVGPKCFIKILYLNEKENGFDTNLNFM